MCAIQAVPDTGKNCSIVVREMPCRLHLYITMPCVSTQSLAQLSRLVGPAMHVAAS